MKKIIFLLVGFAFLFSCNEKKKGLAENTDVLADNLSGHVQETISTNYKVDTTGKAGDEDSCCVIISKYDQKGYITEYDNNDKAERSKNSESFTHDDNGLVKEVKISINGTVNSTINIKAYSGKYISATELDSSNKLKNYYTDITQNEYGELTGMKKFNADSSLSGTMSSTFNKQIFTGNETKDSTGKVIYSSTVKLDDKNNPVENTEKNMKDSTKTTVTKYKYDSFDDKGNWTQRTETGENGKPTKITKRDILYYNE